MVSPCVLCRYVVLHEVASRCGEPGKPELMSLARPDGSIDRRTALRAAGALVLGAVPVTGCGAGPAPGAPRSDAGSHVASAGAASPPGVPRSVAESGPPPGEVTHGPRDRPKVALTFHGQGSPAQVRALLDELERGGARVTVLAVGGWLQDQPAMARRILDGGHELGNHTQNHLDIAAMDPSRALAEITDCAAVLKRLTGSIGTWFRPSQTQHCTEMIRTQAGKAGYPTCLSYDLDSLDYTNPGADAIARTVGGRIRNGSIVSLHCGHSDTVAAIPRILDRLRQRGLRPVTMHNLMS